MSIVDLIFLILVANASPILATFAMRSRLNHSVDLGLILSDGRPVFGESQTIRGIVAAVSLTTVAAILMGHPAICGTLVGGYSMLGDLFSSFVKRRLRLPPGSRARVLDQLPEALLPTIVLTREISLSAGEVTVVVVSFILLAVTLSPMLFILGIRKRWY